MKGHFDNHCHTMYSNVSLSADSIIRPEQLLERAKALGLKGVAITDHAVISSHVKVLQYYLNKCKEDESWKDFTLGLGEEIYLCENGRSKETAQRGQRYPHCIVIAKDEIGHRQLRQISSKAWDRSFTLFVRRVPSWYSDLEEAIGNDKGHLIVTSACVGGILRNAFDNNKSEEDAKKILDWMQEWIGDDFYLEIAPAEYPEVIEYNKWIIELSKKYNIKLVFACDAHYLTKDDFKVHKAYLQSKEEERETESFYKYTYLQDDEEARKHLSYVSDELFTEMVNNSHEMANSIKSYDLFSPQLVPHLDDDRINNSVWKEQINECRVNPKHEYINKYVASESEDDRYFIYLVLNKLKELSLSKEKQTEYLERIEKECLEYWLTSERLGQTISSYILMVREIERIMWEEANSLVGIARGSAGSTLVNYLCGLTQMNPLEQGIYLPEWRFIHHSKVELPDVDVDSEASKKELIRAKLKEKAMRTGGDAVAICTFGTEGPRSAVLTAARSYGLTPDEGQYISSLIKQERGFSWSVTDCYYGNKDKDREPVQEFVEAMDKHPGLLEIVLGLEGLVSRSGIHACFASGTLVLTSKGYKDIEDIEAGDFVYTHKRRYRKVLSTFVNYNGDNNKLIEFSGPNILKPIVTTFNHPFYVKRNGEVKWLEADKIEEDDELYLPQEDKWFQLECKRLVPGETWVYNLEVEEDNSYTANGVAVHNCGINVLNHPIYYNNALMRAPNGTETTQFDLGDSDYMGGLKMDCLTVEALDKIHTCMDLLMQDGYMEWQGSLRETYNKYLHPDALDRTTLEMWKLIAENKLIDAFQMDSTVAKQSLAAIKPSTIPQLAQLNTLMRLMPEKGQKTPVEEYVEFKEHPEKLRGDIYKLNATDEEKKILYEFMKPYGGVLDSQESAMLAVMLPFTNYDVPHANKIRKIIA